MFQNVPTGRYVSLPANRTYLPKTYLPVGTFRNKLFYVTSPRRRCDVAILSRFSLMQISVFTFPHTAKIPDLCGSSHNKIVVTQFPPEESRHTIFNAIEPPGCTIKLGGFHIWHRQHFLIPPPPCHCHKSAGFVPFVYFLGTPSPHPLRTSYMEALLCGLPWIVKSILDLPEEHLH